ncbi:MAG: PilX N-terminal domain-containing pilus assembly protein [Candidatus Methylomirabilales bacterium]
MKATQSENRANLPDSNERGVVLVVTLLVIAALSLLGAAFLGTSLTEAKISANAVDAARTFNIGEAGLEHAKRSVLGADVITILANGGTPSFGPSVPFDGGSYQVVVSNNCTAIGAYPADTVGCPPLPASDGDMLVVVTSTGTYQNSRRVVNLLLEVPPVTAPPAPVYMLPGFDSDPTHDNVKFTMNGAAFDITGNDTNLDGTPGSGSPQFGVAVPTEARSNLETESASHLMQITGAGGNGSISTTASSPLTKDALCNLRNQLTPQADQVFTSGTTISGGEQIGTIASPQITWAQDQFRMQGNGANGTSGAGVLIVDRKFIMRGNAKFYGIVILCGQGEVEFGGSAELYGAIFAVNTGGFSGNSGETRFRVDGNAQVFSSRQALAVAAGVLPSTVRAWWETTN